MPETAAGTRSGRRAAVEAGAAVLGMAVFGTLAHAAFPLVLLAWLGLVVTTAAVLRTWRATGSAVDVLGLPRPSPATAVFIAVGAFLGLTMAIFFRWHRQIDLFPAGIASFAITAAAIGAAEELVFRGYVQGRLAGLGAMLAVPLAAAGHTLYKCSLFVLPQEGVIVNFPLLAIATLVGGCLFGLLRQRSGSVLPPLVAHVVFDVLVYGELADAPWWVWT